MDTIKSKKDIQDLLDNMTEEQKTSLVSVFKDNLSNLISKYEVELKEAENNVLKSTQEEKELWELERVADYKEREKFSAKRIVVRIHIKAEINKVRSLKNLTKCLQNNGMSIEFKDKLDFEHLHVPDFREIDTKNIIFNEETILIDPIPVYVPIIDEENFVRKGFIFDAIRFDKNTYLLCTTNFDESKSFEGYSHFVVVTLDQLVLISEYYYIRAKANANAKAEEKTKRSEEYYDKLPYETRLKHLSQKGYYNSLPVVVKKKVTQAEYEALSLEEKEKLYKPFKKYNAERLKSKLEEDKMWVSFHDMYQRFVNKDAHPINRLGELQIGKKPNPTLFGNPETFKYWKVFREMMDYKIKDIKAQREYLSEGYLVAFETSFGESNTSIALKEKYGILIKRQNGEQIKPTEQNQIETAFSEIEKVYGNLRNIALKKNLKISHTGKKMVFSQSKAIGLYIPSMGTVSVSDKYGDKEFKSVMAHELAHFIDNYVGELIGKMNSSDDYESTAGILAFTFRNNMNKPKHLQNDYINATQECFARALQQYFGIEHFGEEADISYSYKQLDKTIPLFNSDNYVNKDKYYSEIKPLIQKFLQENKDIFTFTVDIDNTNVPLPIGTEKESVLEVEITSEQDEIKEALETLELVLDGAKEEDKKELTEAIEILQLLLN